MSANIKTWQERCGAPINAKHQEWLGSEDAMEDEIADLRAALAAAERDAKRLDWLDQNIFSAPMDDFDAKLHRGYWAWRTFAPKDVQGSARRIIDAAMSTQEKGEKSE